MKTPEKPEKKTRVERFVDWCQNNKLVSVIIIIGVVVIALSQFTEALDKLHSFFKPDKPAVEAIHPIPKEVPDAIQTARTSAQEVLTKLAAVRFLGSPTYAGIQRNALNNLMALGRIEEELRQGFVIRSTGQIPLTGADRTKGLKIRDETLNEFQTNLSAALEDWQAAATVIELTKTNTPIILRTAGLSAEGAALTGQLPQLEGLEKFLLAGVAAGKGEFKDVNLTTFDAIKNSEKIAFRLQEEIPALMLLRTNWVNVQKRCDQISK